MATKKPEPFKSTTWTLQDRRLYKIAAKAVRLGEIEALDEAASIEKAAAEFQSAGHEAYGDTKMTRRKGEITRNDLKRK